MAWVYLKPSEWFSNKIIIQGNLQWHYWVKFPEGFFRWLETGSRKQYWVQIASYLPGAAYKPVEAQKIHFCIIQSSEIYGF